MSIQTHDIHIYRYKYIQEDRTQVSKVKKTSQKLHGVAHALSSIVHPVSLKIAKSTSSFCVLKVTRQMLQVHGAVLGFKHIKPKDNQDRQHGNMP